MTYNVSSGTLTLSSSVVSNGYTSKRSGPYWSNPPFIIGAQGARMSQIKNGGLEQYGTERFGRLIFATIRKSVGLKGLNLTIWYNTLYTIQSY